MTVRRSPAKPHGYTLVELVAAMASAAALMVGITSSLFTAMRASNPANTPAASILEGAACLADISADMQFAQAVPTATPKVFEATLPDRNGDGNPETIRYAWAGPAGAPLVRTYNGAAANRFANMYDFKVTYYPNPAAPAYVTIQIQVTASAATAVETTFALVNIP
jgi:hypothetical protein